MVRSAWTIYVRISKILYGHLSISTNMERKTIIQVFTIVLAIVIIFFFIASEPTQDNIEMELLPEDVLVNLLIDINNQNPGGSVNHTMFKFSSDYENIVNETKRWMDSGPETRDFYAHNISIQSIGNVTNMTKLDMINYIDELENEFQVTISEYSILTYDFSFYEWDVYKIREETMDCFKVDGNWYIYNENLFVF